MARISRLEGQITGQRRTLPDAHAEAGNLDRVLARAVTVVAALFVLAALALGAVYYLRHYYQPPGAVDREIAAMEERIRRQPRDVGLRIQAAYLYVDRARHDDAIAQASVALSAAPDNVDALQVLGIAFAGKNDRDRAIAYFERAVALSEAHDMAKASRQLASIRVYLGQAYFEDGRLDEAIAELRAAAESDSTNADALRLLGDALLLRGDPAGAAASFQRAVRLDPGFAEAYDGLAAAYEAFGDSTGVAYARAMSSYTTGDYDAAAAGLQAIAQLWADRPELHLGLAMTFERNGQVERALAEYRETLRLAPDSVAARHGVRRLSPGTE